MTVAEGGSREILSLGAVKQQYSLQPELPLSPDEVQQ